MTDLLSELDSRIDNNIFDNNQRRILLQFMSDKFTSTNYTYDYFIVALMIIIFDISHALEFIEHILIKNDNDPEAGVKVFIVKFIAAQVKKKEPLLDKYNLQIIRFLDNINDAEVIREGSLTGNKHFILNYMSGKYIKPLSKKVKVIRS